MDPRVDERFWRRLVGSEPEALSRRNFLRLSCLAGPGLTLGLMLPAAGRAPAGAHAGHAGVAMPFLRIGTDDRVTVICKHVEAGQGVWTGLPAIVADELDADWSQMQVESAPAEVPTYGNFAFDPKGGMQGTGGSTSIANSWKQLREAGATARAMLVSAAAQAWKVPAGEIKVDRGVVTHAPSGHKARFGELAERAARLPVPTSVTLKKPEQFTLIGRRDTRRLDARAKSEGSQRFAFDVMLPGMMTAVVLRPPRFGGRVASVDASAAKAVPGVVDVVEIPRGVAVVARDTWSALRGREALKVEWDESAVEKRGTRELLEEFRRLAAQPPTGTATAIGDIGAGLKAAAKQIDATFEFPYLAHAPMEPLSAVCQLSGNECRIWAGAQFHTVDQMNAARAVGLQPSQVKIETLAAGGTFGRRANFESDYIAEVASVAKATGGRYPVKLIWTREDDIRGGRYRPLNLHRVTAGIDARGELSAWRQRVVGQSIMGGTPLEALFKNGVDPTATEGHAAEQYTIPNAEVTWSRPQVGVPVLWWRSVGHSHIAFSKEVILDELAEAAGKDPVAFRLALLNAHPRHAAVLRLAAEKAGWNTPFAGGHGRGRGIALHESFNSVVAQVAEVTVKDNAITVDRVVCVVDCGTAVNPDVIEAQMQSGIGYGLAAALHGRITLTDGHVDQANFHQYEVLRLPGMPKRIEVHIVPSNEAPTGVGEPGTPPIAPAVANAVRAATGKRLRRLPFDLAAAEGGPA